MSGTAGQIQIAASGGTNNFYLLSFNSSLAKARTRRGLLRILDQEGGGEDVRRRPGRRLLAAGDLRGGAGRGHSDRGHLSGGRADVSGGGAADCLRLGLLPAVVERGGEGMNIVVWKSPKALRGILRKLFRVKA